MSRLYLISFSFLIVVLALVWSVSPPESNSTVCYQLCSSASNDRITLSGILSGSQHKNFPIFD